MPSLPDPILRALDRADPSWRPILQHGLAAMSPAYLDELARAHFLPTDGRLFAAFALPLDQVRYVLVGEGPYPRAESATGVCFMDGAVGELWCAEGLSKPVNRATSLRNFMKMLLVCAGHLDPAATNGEAVAAAAAAVRAGAGIATMAELQENLLHHGFLLLNAALVFRPEVAPAVDARAWQPFLQVVLATLAAQPRPPTLVLWGKIAQQLNKLPQAQEMEQRVSEHPFNVSFIHHPGMQDLFGPLQLLERQG
jgi:uracil-DNA glycosylase